MACVCQRLPEIDRSDFKKIKTKDLKKSANPRLGTADKNDDRSYYDEGWNDTVIE